MRKLTLLAATVVALTSSLPLRADIILTYHLSSFVPAVPGDVFPPASPIPINDPLGPALTGPNAGTPNSLANPLIFGFGETKFVQIAINANSNAPTSVNGQNQLNWTTANDGNTLTNFGFAFNYPVSLVTNPFTPPVAPLLNQNIPNARGQSGPQPAGGGASQYSYATAHPISYTNYNLGGTAIGGLDTGVGIGVGPSGFLDDTIIAVFKVRSGFTQGSGSITLTDLNPASTQTGFGLLDGTNLDEIIFAPAHNNFPLFIQVVPEPSSIILVGLALGGMLSRPTRRVSMERLA